MKFIYAEAITKHIKQSAILMLVALVLFQHSGNAYAEQTKQKQLSL